MLDLEAIELIKQLKARYFRFLDTRNIEGLETVFTADAIAHFKGGSYEFKLDGWQALKTFYELNFSDKKFGMHLGHHPEISVNGDKASAYWYLNDYFINLENNTNTFGSAIYEDQYAKIDGEWKITAIVYERLLEELTPRRETDQYTVTSSPIGKQPGLTNP